MKEQRLKLEWLDGYCGESTAELLSYKRGYHLESIVLAFHDGLEEKAARVGLEGLSDEEKTVLATSGLIADVTAGGFYQFLSGTTLESFYRDEIVAALQRIGCAEVAALTQTAVELVKKTDSEDPDEADDALEALDDCDDKFEDVSEATVATILSYIEANREHIKLP